MSDSSIKAEIQFESYKIDRVDFSVTQEFDVLSSKNHSDCEVKYTFGFRNAQKRQSDNKIAYVTGLQVNIVVTSKKTEKELAKGSFIATGLFSANVGIQSDLEKSLVTCQGPAILFPYVRAAITLTLSTAGFSTMVMPLVNVYEMAKNNPVEIENIN